jgi:hypothetical protein
MPEEKSDQEKVNWTAEPFGQFSKQPKVLIEIDEWGIKIIDRETRVIYLDMSYTDITDISSRLDSAEAEIGRLTDAINGMKEVGY